MPDNLSLAFVRSEWLSAASAQSDSCQMMKELVRGSDGECVFECVCAYVCDGDLYQFDTLIVQ